MGDPHLPLSVFLHGRPSNSYRHLAPTFSQVLAAGSGTLLRRRKWGKRELQLRGSIKGFSQHFEVGLPVAVLASAALMICVDCSVAFESMQGGEEGEVFWRRIWPPLWEMGEGGREGGSWSVPFPFAFSVVCFREKVSTLKSDCDDATYFVTW